ncbi:hypothetical protein EVAR_90348_1 [Eumeta japonica]|uniref:Uncharacterized protein n=1 Tax=Eumeta variegata TaxID=151549 RepID=A0A4C1YKK9_EUMVA|nr:hypothetical protein EVAR_90348_1 [Eumeta japonica]
MTLTRRHSQGSLVRAEVTVTHGYNRRQPKRAGRQRSQRSTQREQHDAKVIILLVRSSYSYVHHKLQHVYIYARSDSHFGYKSLVPGLKFVKCDEWLHDKGWPFCARERLKPTWPVCVRGAIYSTTRHSDQSDENRDDRSRRKRHS